MSRRRTHQRPPLVTRAKYALIDFIWRPRIRAVLSLTFLAIVALAALALGWALLSLFILVGTTSA